MERASACGFFVGWSINDPPLTRWVWKERALATFVGWSINDPPLTRWVCKERALAAFCRLEHQRPTSDEVGMERARACSRKWTSRDAVVGCNSRNRPLTRSV